MRDPEHTQRERGNKLDFGPNTGAKHVKCIFVWGEHKNVRKFPTKQNFQKKK